MNQIKSTIITILQVCIWLTLLVGLNDPGLAAGRSPDHVYNTYWFIINPLYSITGYVTYPLEAILQFFGLYNPDSPSGWFPLMGAQEFKDIFATPLGMGGLVPDNLFEGAIIWWIPIASVMLWVFSYIFDHFYERFYNWAWNIIVEYLFQRKRARLYQQALEQRNTDIARLNKQYTVLAQETYSLKDSVVTDELTAIYNKRFFLERLKQEFDQCKQEKMLLSIIMIDIDYFKRLNDTYGHLAGDHVLKSVAAVLKRFVPERCYPCRYGGEEFAIILPKKNLQEAVEAARLLQENMQRLKFEQIDPKLRVTISQGVCTVDFSNPEMQKIKTFDQILEAADKELYRSKMSGRNRVSVNNLMGQKASS